MTEAALRAIYAEETAPYRRAAVRWGPVERQGIRTFGAWCAQHGIDPRLWIRARHRAIAETLKAGKGLVTVRSIRPEGLIAPKYLERFREWAEAQAAESLAQEQLAATVETDPPLWGAELFPHAEAIKRAMRPTPELCLGSSLTLGYHPGSPHCLACPLASRCREITPSRSLAARSLPRDRC